MLRARSMENAFPSVYCNTVGQQKDFSFFGGSKIVSASGIVTTEAKLDEEDFVTGIVDIDAGLRIRRHWLLFRERNPSLYSALTAPLEELVGEPPVQRASARNILDNGLMETRTGNTRSLA
jgi:predicted amidohydrolase